jgi:hypothetical protein
MQKLENDPTQTIIIGSLTDGKINPANGAGSTSIALLGMNKSKNSVKSTLMK